MCSLLSWRSWMLSKSASNYDFYLFHYLCDNHEADIFYHHTNPHRKKASPQKIITEKNHHRKKTSPQKIIITKNHHHKQVITIQLITSWRRTWLVGIYTTTALFLSSCSLSTNNNTWVVSLSSSFHMKLSSFSLDGREAVYPVWGWQGEQGTNTRRTLIKHCVFMYLCIYVYVYFVYFVYLCIGT